MVFVSAKVSTCSCSEEGVVHHCSVEASNDISTVLKDHNATQTHAFKMKVAGERIKQVSHDFEIEQLEGKFFENPYFYSNLDLSVTGTELKDLEVLLDYLKLKRINVSSVQLTENSFLELGKLEHFLNDVTIKDTLQSLDIEKNSYDLPTNELRVDSLTIRSNGFKKLRELRVKDYPENVRFEFANLIRLNPQTEDVLIEIGNVVVKEDLTVYLENAPRSVNLILGARVVDSVFGFPVFVQQRLDGAGSEFPQISLSLKPRFENGTEVTHFPVSTLCEQS